MPDEIEYVLKQGGILIRRDTTERNVAVGDQVINQLAMNSVTQVKNVFACSVNNLPTFVSVITRGREFYCSFRMNTLTIKSPFRLVDGILIPMFSSPNDPVMPMVWVVPPNMKLRVLLQMTVEPGAPYRSVAAIMWLYAYDNNGNAYRLPLPNLYDDCKVCTGTQGRTLVQTMQLAIEQHMETFRVSTWNADLWTTVTESQTLFRFKPEGDEFKPLPVAENWFIHCKKVATAFSAMIPLT